MLDITKREITVGDYIAYAKSSGRSAFQCIYHVREILESGVKAHQMYHESHYDYKRKYQKFVYNDRSQKGEWVDMTDKEREKVDKKTTIISMSSQAIILDNFDPVAHRFI